MTRGLALALFVAACGPSAGELRREAEQHNLDAENAAIAALVRSRGLQEIDRPEPVREDDATRKAPIVRGRGDGTTDLVALPSSLAVAELWCEPRMRTSCGCMQPLRYRYFRDASGTTVVVKEIPDAHVRTVHRSSCTVGCGKPYRPPERTLRALGAIDSAQVEVVDLRYATERIHEICDTELKAP